MLCDAPLSSLRAEPSIMRMPRATERWTAQRVRSLPDDGNRYELVSGELVVTPAPGYFHQAGVLALYDRLGPWARESGIGKVMLSPADLSLGDDEILQPDLFAFRVSGSAPAGSWADVRSLLLAVEVLSPSTARHDRTLKRLRYQRAAVPEYWIVDLDARLVERWRPTDGRPEILTERIEWTGLAIDLAALFAEIHGE